MNFQQFLEEHKRNLVKFVEFVKKNFPEKRFSILRLSYTEPQAEIDAGIEGVVQFEDGRKYEVYIWMPHEENFWDSDQSCAYEIRQNFPFPMDKVV